MLDDFCDDGIYSKYFKGSSNLSFGKDFVVVDFGRFSNDAKLKSIIAKIMLMRIQKEIHDSPRDTRKTIFGDWTNILSKDPESARLAQFFVRLARRSFASIVTVAQSLSDCMTNPTAFVVYRHSAYKLFLKPLKDEIKTEDEVLGLSKDAIDAIKSIKNVPCVYSEGVLLQGEEYFPIRLMFDKFSIRLYSTTGPEVIEVENIWKEEKCGWIESIERAVARKKKENRKWQ